MNGRTKGVVIALASGAAGGLLPAAVSAQIAGAYGLAMGLAAIAAMNAAISFIHINAAETAPRARVELRKPDAMANRMSMQSGNIEIMAEQSVGLRATRANPPKESLNFPVLGWYALPGEEEELPLDVAMKKPARSRA